MKSITISKLGDLCDSPKRNKSKREVIPVLIPIEDNGLFGLQCTVRDDHDGKSYLVHGSDDRPLRFRSVEHAIKELCDVNMLRARLEIDLSNLKDWSGHPA